MHNRKIRYTKDIVAVQSEFKRYKDLKNDVAKIEKLLKHLQGGGKWYNFVKLSVAQVI